EGARLYGGRWNPKGYPIVYTAESRSLALLEMLVQDDPLRANYVLVPAHIPNDLSITIIQTQELPEDWRNLSTRDTLQTVGKDWLTSMRSAILSVPSAVLPAERNYLINPNHPDFQKIMLGSPESLQTDMRLYKK
ncbi:MAG TPA: RES family NAD+ phosphorylase, partial [Thiotrichales bacterium]|nr:RES family NAD+ phosphorylase [Thiotrichales bacterium]